MIISPPMSEAILLSRANTMVGCCVADIAERLGVKVPTHQGHRTRAKGFIGQLLEKYLGADAGSNPEPDFTQLGIELKTLPISFQGKPLESTYVCTAPKMALQSQSWETSTVRLKLQRVLWIPMARDKSTPWERVRIATPLLWSPNEVDLATLKNDWEELSEKICCGESHKVTAAWGNYLQLRPKAAHSRILTSGWNAEGDSALIPPMGFYLRACFTEMILNQYFDLSVDKII